MTLLNITGLDYYFENIKLHNPSILEIAEKIDNEEDFLFALKILSTSITKIFPIKTLPKNVTDFDIVLSLLSNPINDYKSISKEKLSAMLHLLQLLFFEYSISLSNSEILLTKNNDIFILNSKNFPILQKNIYSMFKLDFLFNENMESKDIYNPASERAREIAEKLKRGREKVVEINNKSEKNKTGIIENYVIIISVGLNLNPIEVSKMTFYQILTLFERIKMKIEWDIDLSCRLAGGNPEEHPEHWMSIL